MENWDPAQWTLFFTGVGVLSTTLVGGIVKIIIALKAVSSQVQALEVKVDGRLTQLLSQTALASRAEGVTVGRGEMAAAPIAPADPVAPADPAGEELVIGIPVPTPPILLVPVEDEGKRAKGEPPGPPKKGETP